MDGVYLPLAIKNTSITLENILAAIKKTSSFEYKALYFERISSLYRQMGIGDYLLSNDTGGLSAFLRAGVQAYVEFLQQADVGEKATSKAVAFFDAICVDDKAQAEALANAAPREINPRKEYEEDFLYMRILMDVFGLGKSKADVTPMLDEFEQLHADYPDERYSLLVALLDGQLEPFEESLEVLIEERLAKYKDGGDLYRGTQDEAAILAHVSTEVVAWLKLARQQGMAVSEEYALAPSSIMAPFVLEPLRPRGWLEFESLRSLEVRD